MSTKYILIYEFNEYAEMDGGTKIEEFTTAKQMHARANELLTADNDFRLARTDNMYSDFRGLEVKCEYTYEPVEKVTQYRPVMGVK